jgi:flagellar biogenesis protein FliO
VNLPELPSTAAPRDAATGFIDVTAKLSLLMAALSIAWSLFQLILAGLLQRLDVVGWLQQREMPVPATMQWAAQHMLALSLLQLLASLALLAVSWGLLKRRHWGRIGFIVFLVLVALANFACLPLIQDIFDSMYALVPGGFLDSPQGQDMRAQLQISRWTALLTASITALAFAVLHGWLVIKLQRPDVRRQFR